MLLFSLLQDSGGIMCVFSITLGVLELILVALSITTALGLLEFMSVMDILIINNVVLQ